MNNVDNLIEKYDKPKFIAGDLNYDFKALVKIVQKLNKQVIDIDKRLKKIE